MRAWLAAAAAALLTATAAHADTPRDLTPEQQQELVKLQALARDLHPQFGDVAIPEAAAKLHLGKAYYFLAPVEAKRVLTEAWRNPPEATGGVLGMVFPAGHGFNDSWGAVITFDGAGFVSDKQATPAEYDQLIKDAQGQEEAANGKRKEGGFAPIHLVGWAQAPSYDKANHTVIWARDIRFGDQSDDALNYDLRVLGRRGVLSLNLVSKMSELPQIRPAAEQLRATATFDSGATFEDFKPGVDKTTGYGLAGLIGAGLGLAVVKKLGLLAIGLVFLKKLFVVVIAVVAGVGNWFRRRFSRPKKAAAIPPTPAAIPPSPLPKTTPASDPPAE